jgi:hypothetical protein
MTKARQRVSKRLRSAKERKELIPKRSKTQEKTEVPKPVEIDGVVRVWVLFFLSEIPARPPAGRRAG